MRERERDRGGGSSVYESRESVRQMEIVRDLGASFTLDAVKSAFVELVLGMCSHAHRTILRYH